MKIRMASFLAAIALLGWLLGGLRGCAPGGQADITSWGQINQQVTRPDDWQRIVENSPFALGDAFLQKGDGWEETQLSWGSYPSIDGSTVCVPMAMEFAWQHLDMSAEDAEFFCSFSTTHYAYEMLIEKESRGCWLPSRELTVDSAHPLDLFLGTPPSEEELALAEEKGVALALEPVCYDAFVFITHRDNPVDSLTLEQLRGIYTGEITNWREVGGRDEPITAYQREENSGSQTSMEQLVMDGAPMLPPETVEIQTGMGGLVEAVAEYQNHSASIGYTFQYYINNLYKSDKIKTLAIDGVAPSPENLQSEAYPLTSFYYGVVREEDLEGIPGDFLRWMASDEGQRCIGQAGYVPL